jgi:hypothetical protein
MKTTFIILIFLLLPILCFGEIYKWKDENGRLYFSDVPPANPEKEGQTIINGYNGKSNSSGSESSLNSKKIREMAIRTNSIKKFDSMDKLVAQLGAPDKLESATVYGAAYYEYYYDFGDGYFFVYILKDDVANDGFSNYYISEQRIISP